jgi:hypothetical protein
MKGIMVLSAGLEGDVFYSRQEDRTCDLPLRGFRSYPVLVLSINWADSSLGYSWPVYYYVSWIPFNVHYMVTASYDHEDIEGYLDLAFGVFPECALVKTDLKRVVTGHWGDDSMN